MARSKEFDPDVVLGRALELFWRQGYAGTSMAELVEHLGVARASIYATFGGKRELFLKALERYRETTDPLIVEALSGAGAVLPAVRDLVLRYAEESTEPGRLGCMVVNTAVELAGTDADAARSVENSWTTLETCLVSALTRARAQGELAADRDPRMLARMLLVLFQGMRAMGRTSTDPARVRDAARQALALFQD